MTQESPNEKSFFLQWLELPSPEFWKAASLLVGVQLVTGLLAVSLSAYFSYDANLSSIESTLKEQISNVSQEVERRAFPPGIGEDGVISVADLPESLIIDLSTRFPDPITLVDKNGSVIRTIQPDPSYFKRNLEPARLIVETPERIREQLDRDRVIVNVNATNSTQSETWGLAPIYTGGGELIGGLLIQPLTNSVSYEFARQHNAFYYAISIVVALSLCTILLIGGIRIARKSSRSN